jgi:hypothetical protein
MFTFFKDGSQILHKNIYGVTKLARSGKNFAYISKG